MPLKLKKTCNIMKFKESLEGIDIIKKSADSALFTSSALQILNSLDKTREDFWNVDNTSANLLNLLIKISRAKNALEIGTSNGYSAIWLAEALKTTNGKLTTIEFWDNRLDSAIENFKKAGVNDIIETKLGQAVMILEEMLDNMQKSKTPPVFDFVFIDANKSEYIKYFNLVHPMLKRGGIIAADNILSHYKKVEPFVKAVTNHPEYQSQLIPIDTGIMLSFKL